MLEQDLVWRFKRYQSTVFPQPAINKVSETREYEARDVLTDAMKPKNRPWFRFPLRKLLTVYEPRARSCLVLAPYSVLVFGWIRSSQPVERFLLVCIYNTFISPETCLWGVGEMAVYPA